MRAPEQSESFLCDSARDRTAADVCRARRRSRFRRQSIAATVEDHCLGAFFVGAAAAASADVHLQRMS